MKWFWSAGLVSALFLVNALIGADKTCGDMELVRLLNEHCILVRKVTGPAAPCAIAAPITDVCANGASPAVLENLRASVLQSNQLLRGDLEKSRTMYREGIQQLKDEARKLKQQCKNTSLVSALDDLPESSALTVLAVEYLRLCREETSMLPALVADLRLALKRVRFKATKVPNFKPYLEACHDAEIRAAAEATIDTLQLLRHEKIDIFIFTVASYDLEGILMHLESRSRSENLNHLESARRRYARMLEAHLLTKALLQ